MTINSYELERWDGTTRSSPGENGWESLLIHDDITQPGRVKAFAVVNDGAPVKIDLSPNDIFGFVRRTRLAADHRLDLELAGTRTIFGRHQPDGLGYFYVVYPNGDVKVTQDFYKG